MLENIHTISISKTKLADWIVSIRIPGSEGHHPVIILFHGWTGDESAMWIFAPRLPEDALLIAPRGIYPAPAGGFGWHPRRNDRAWPWVDEFLPAIDALQELFTESNFAQLNEGQINLQNLHMVGYSQGAALAYTFSLLHPERVISIAGLSGFLPDGTSYLVRSKPLSGKKAFLAHGIQDELVPVEKARNSVKMLGLAGAQVTYCEDDVGHKLSLSCFRGLEAFFRKE